MFLFFLFLHHLINIIKIIVSSINQTNNPPLYLIRKMARGLLNGMSLGLKNYGTSEKNLI